MKIYYRSVAVFILIDNAGKILLQHKAKDSKVLPDQWAFFGGGIDEGEAPEEAVAREAKEELGLDLRNLKFLGRYVAPFEGGLYEQFVFVGGLTYQLEKLRLQQTEGQGIGLFSLAELKQMQINQRIMKILDDVFKLSFSDTFLPS